MFKIFEDDIQSALLKEHEAPTSFLDEELKEKQLIEEEKDFIADELIFTEQYLVKRHSTVYETLRKAGVSPQEIHNIILASKKVYDLSKVQSGIQVRIDHIGEQKILDSIHFVLSVTDTLWLRKSDSIWIASIESKPVTVQVIGYQGKIKSSLWQSAVDIGMEAQAIFMLSEIFAWQIDFEREIRPGDSWRMLIERTYVDGKPYNWGSILVAEYVKSGDIYQAIKFPQDTISGEYYTPEGDNLRGKFLKSPLRYSRISSKFQLKRFHPILGVNRPHLGVDYAAPRGTPVRAVGDGVVTVCRRWGGNGKMIKIRHSNSIYETAYKHLNGFARGVRRGSNVTQGQVIGYVGSTGLATGPHLHFEFYENGKFTDPLGRKFPREDPVPPSNFETFKLASNKIVDQLNHTVPIEPTVVKFAKETINNTKSTR